MSPGHQRWALLYTAERSLFSRQRTAFVLHNPIFYGVIAYADACYCSESAKWKIDITKQEEKHRRNDRELLERATGRGGG